MPLSPSLLAGLTPTAPDEFAAQRRAQQQQEAVRAAQLRQTQAQEDRARQEMSDARLSRGVSLFGPALQDPDPASRAQKIKAIVPIFNRYVPDAQLDPAVTDETAVRALFSSQIAPKDLLAQQVEMDKARMTDEYRRRALEQQASLAAARAEYAPGDFGPQAAPVGKPLSSPAMKDLEQKANLYQELTRITGGFEPRFAGNTATGGLENWLGRHGGEKLGLADPGQSQWWQDYQGYINQVRNDLFGSALTPTERAEFQKAVVTPGMDPDQVAANLARQQAVVQNALARARNIYQKGGFNREQIAEYAPEDLQPVDVTAPMLGAKTRPGGRTRVIDFNDLPE